MEKSRSWHTVGQGAISAFCTANLLKNHHVKVIGRTNTSVAKTFIPLNGMPITLPTPCIINDKTVIHNVLVAVKAFDVTLAISQLIDSLAKDANIILCHNGLGTIEPVLALLKQKPNCNLYFCTTNSGAHVKNNDVHLAAIGNSFWQAIKVNTPQTGLTNRDFSEIFVDATQVDDLVTLLWQKLAINCAINPLTALHQINNGELAQSQFQSIIKPLLAEVVACAKQEGARLEYDATLELVTRVIHSTANNRSSMCQDIANGKPTEIDFINGYIVKTATAHKIDTPINSRLVDQIKQLQ